MNKSIRKFISYTVFGIIVSIIACSTIPNNDRKLVKIIIYPNTTASEVAMKLHDNGILTGTKTFLFWARILGYDKKIKSGRYNFQPKSSLFTVLKTLNQGGTNKALVTIPEGYNIKDIAMLLDSEGICSEKSFIKACLDKILLRSLNIYNTNAEGYLFPDSYDFSISTNPAEIIERMVKRFWQIYDEIAKTRNTKSLDTIITIASLVEKEAKLENERPIIASVFYNRLKFKMPLQSCATVEYVLNNHKEQLSVEDTKIESPYNTYLHRGLPPTPICNPGCASIIAAMNPVQTKYLYFAVDNNGSHHFTQSFSEHQNFLRRKNRKATDEHRFYHW